jgi:hypothetical protein
VIAAAAKSEIHRPSDEIIKEIRIHLSCISELRQELLKQGLSLNFVSDQMTGQLMASVMVFRGVR